MKVMAPKDENELRHMLYTAIYMDGPVCLRYPRGKGLGVSLDEEMHALEIGKAELLSPAYQNRLNARIALSWPTAHGGAGATGRPRIGQRKILTSQSSTRVGPSQPDEELILRLARGLAALSPSKITGWPEASAARSLNSWRLTRESNRCAPDRLSRPAHRTWRSLNSQRILWHFLFAPQRGRARSCAQPLEKAMVRR